MLTCLLNRVLKMKNRQKVTHYRAARAIIRLRAGYNVGQRRGVCHEVGDTKGRPRCQSVVIAVGRSSLLKETHAGVIGQLSDPTSTSRLDAILLRRPPRVEDRRKATTG
jgi:hypothetical protein